MKLRISFIADGSNILGIVQALANNTVPIEGIYIEPVQDGETITATQKAPTKPKSAKANKQKRKVGRPKLHLPDRIVAAVRQLQDSAVGATLKNIKREVKSPSVSPAITDLIKQKKITRTKPGLYKVA